MGSYWPWDAHFAATSFQVIQSSNRHFETAALMLGSDKSRGYCLEMICADFLAGANIDSENSRALADGISRLFKFLPETQKQALLHDVVEQVS